MVQTLCYQAFSHNGDPCVTPDKISQTVLFPELFDKPLVATFDREQASSDGGGRPPQQPVEKVGKFGPIGSI